MAELPARQSSRSDNESTRNATSEVSSASLNSSSPVVFIALHAGAGYHNPAHHVDLQELFHAACQVALTQAGSAEEAVYLAIQLLEASPLTNAGRGSVLTEDGRVECEASMMLGNGAYSGVGAVCGVEHPIQLAYQLVKERNEYGLIKELGRVRPILLVGEGAWKYAEERGFARVGPQEWHDHHVTEETRKKWKKFRAIIDKHKEKQEKAREDVRSEEQRKVAERQQQSQQGTQVPQLTSRGPPSTLTAAKKRPRSPESLSPRTAHLASPALHSDDDSGGDTPFHGKQHGTVGAIACDNRGRVCAGVSSGGIWMKTAGRIGSAALIGCGCHAENGDENKEEDQREGNIKDAISVACSISGCGEDIIEELMAVRCCDALKSAKLSPAPNPSNTVLESNAPIAIDSNHHHSSSKHGDSSDNSETQTELQRIMKQLIEKEAMRQATFTANDKKRRKNAQGSNDTQQQDDGLSSGIIACRVVKKRRSWRTTWISHGVRDGGNGWMDDGSLGEQGQSRQSAHGNSSDRVGSHSSAVQSEELTLDFCYAHTAPHFAVGYAVNDKLHGYENKGWISQQTEEQSRRRIMKIGHISIAVTPRHKQLQKDSDGEVELSQHSSGNSGGKEQQQRRAEDGADGHAALSANTTQSNGRTELERGKKIGIEDQRNTGKGNNTTVILKLSSKRT